MPRVRFPSLAYGLAPLMGLLSACGSTSDTQRGGGAAGGEHGDAGASPMQPGESGGDAGTSQGGGFGDGGPDEVCADVHVTPKRSVPSVVFLVDGSSSMRCVYPEDPECDCEAQVAKQCVGNGSLTRWQALRWMLLGDGAGLEGVLAPLEGTIRFGLTVYNDNPNLEECPGLPVRIAPALDGAASIAAAFPAEPPGFNTPTGLALSALVEELPDAAQRDAQDLGPQRVVLATDGQPFACMDRDTLEKPPLDYAGVLAATDQAVSKDIDVYVMSLAPTSGDYATHLSEVAQRGRTSTPFAPANADELRDALRDIIEDAISCTLELSGKVQNPLACAGSAVLGDTALECGAADGFSIVDATHVRLEGAACTRFKREPGIELSMTFPCEAIVLQ